MNREKTVMAWVIVATFFALTTAIFFTSTREWKRRYAVENEQFERWRRGGFTNDPVFAEHLARARVTQPQLKAAYNQGVTNGVAAAVQRTIVALSLDLAALKRQAVEKASAK